MSEVLAAAVGAAVVLVAWLVSGIRQPVRDLLADDDIAGTCCPVDHTDVDEHADAALQVAGPVEPTQLVQLCRETWRRNHREETP